MMAKTLREYIRMYNYTTPEEKNTNKEKNINGMNIILGLNIIKSAHGPKIVGTTT